ncbi:MAG TPA: hypothetical protein VFX30_01695 [bacterium]|nr:hypothetical protein [bacterium]
MHLANKVRFAAVVGFSLWVSAAFAQPAFERAPAVDATRIPDNGIIVNTCAAYAPESLEYNCCKNGVKEGTIDWDCCTGKSSTCDDGDACTTDTCLGKLGLIGPDGKVVSGGFATCQHVKNIRCIPVNTCAKKYAGNDEAVKCCDMGFDTDPAKQKCCVQHLTHGEDPGTPENPKPCGGNETCPTCPDCPRPPVIDCNVIADPTMKACCVAKGGMLYFVMDSCAKTSSDCNIIANIGGDVNGQVNICCNVLNNTGTITDSTITQACSNINNPGGGTAGGTATGTPTTPQGSPSAALSCTVAGVGAPVDGKWTVTYTAPASVGSIASATLTQVSGPQIRVDGGTDDGGFGTDLAGPKSMSTKSITDLSNPPPFNLTSPTPKSMLGNWQAPFQVKVSLNDLAGNELASTPCESTFKLEAKGSGSGCGLLGEGLFRAGADAVSFLFLFGAAPLLWFRKKRNSSES